MFLKIEDIFEIKLLFLSLKHVINIQLLTGILSWIYINLDNNSKLIKPLITEIMRVLTNLILTTNALCQQDLLDLLEGRYLMIRIYPLVDRSKCKRWVNPIEKSDHLVKYSNADDVYVNRMGMTLFETENRREKMEEYFKIAQSTHDYVEHLLDGDNPIKVIHNHFKAAWENDCIVENIGGRLMTPGIIRSFEANPKGGLPPHTDLLHKDVPHHNPFKNIKKQLAVNLYLNVPENGGELEVWDYEPNEEQEAMLMTGEYDFLDRDKIPVEPLVVKPRVGEMILFRSSCVHAVRASKGGKRTATSCFVGYYGNDKPLTYWA